MGASMALAGVTACTRQPAEKIVPYVRQPEEIIPGRPLFFATAMSLGGVATGLLVESHEGRPTKIEGNPLHPSSRGATDIYAQAAILGLYDPDRSQTVTNLGEIRPWSTFLAAIRAAVTAQQPLKGAGIRLLTESVSSPSLARRSRRPHSLPLGEVASMGPGKPRERARARSSPSADMPRCPVSLRPCRHYRRAGCGLPRWRPRCASLPRAITAARRRH
jgi:molybdopterin-containing oxidoreductase family iron-sulfur binding subunit